MPPKRGVPPPTPRVIPKLNLALGSRRGPIAAVFGTRHSRALKMREGFADRRLKLLQHLRLGFEKLVIVPGRHDQRRFIRRLNDPDAVIGGKRGDEINRVRDMIGLASKTAVTSEEAGRIDAVGAQS